MVLNTFFFILEPRAVYQSTSLLDRDGGRGIHTLSPLSLPGSVQVSCPPLRYEIILQHVRSGTLCVAEFQMNVVLFSFLLICIL